MTRITAQSLETAHRPATAPAAARPTEGSATRANTPAAPTAPAVSAQNTPAPAAPAMSAAVMGVLIGAQSQDRPAQDLHSQDLHSQDLQSQDLQPQGLQSVVQTYTGHSTSPAPAQNGTPTSQDHGAGLSSSGNADHGAASAHEDGGHGGDHTDRGWHRRPPEPSPAPPPAPAPQPVVIPSFDPSLPSRAIAEAAQTLADGRAAEAQRTAFVTASAERRAEAFVAQGQAALAVFKDMRSQYAAWQDQQAPSRTGYLKALYA